jgi:uncharacterized delta-60 repeat protein
MHRYRVSPIIFCVSVLFAVHFAVAQPGTLDTTFGSGGFVTTSVNFFTASGWATAVAVQPDVNIVAAVTSYNYENTGRDFYVLRYAADGTLDPNFGSGGVVRFAFDSTVNSETPEALALQPDGKILVAGRVGTSADAGIARLNSDGSLDLTFGNGGKVMFVYVNRAVAAVNAIAVHSDGRIVVAGASDGINFALARFKPDGTFDTTFNGTGKVTIAMATKQSSARIDDLVIQSDGKYVASGVSGATKQNPQTMALVRVNNNGALDSTFGSGGKVITNFGGAWSVARKLAIDSAGRIVVGGDWLGSVGTSGDPSSYVFLRYLTNGQLDSTFGSAGKVIFTANSFRRMESMAIQSDGKIVGAGWHRNPITLETDIAVLRINVNGALDAGFGTGGFTFTDYNGSMDEAHDMAIQADGKIVVAGTLNGYGSNGSAGLARYLP